MGGVERCEVDQEFLDYMDATAEGGAYIGKDKKSWCSVRDTWCNSHRETGGDGRDRKDLTGEGDAEESSEQTSKEDS